MTEVVAALLRDKEKFMICQRPEHKARGLLRGGRWRQGRARRDKRVSAYLRRSGRNFRNALCWRSVYGCRS